MKKLVLLADPPWEYAPRDPKKKFGYGATGWYKTLNEDEIFLFYKQCAKYTQKYQDVAFFNWVTNPKLPLFFKAIEHMNEGFTKKESYRYSTKGFTWIKLNRGNRLPFKGPGNFSASNEEGCYLLVKGSMPPVEKLVDSVILECKSTHSKKPIEVFKRIERMYPPGENHRHVELFAREKTNDNWEVFGNEINGNDIFDDLKNLSN